MNVNTASAEALNNLFEQFKPDDQPNNGNWNRFDVVAYLNKYGYEVQRKKTHRNSTLFCLKHCIFNPDHKDNEAAIGQTADGTLFYQCFHDSCKGKTWHDARQKISGNDRISEGSMQNARAFKYVHGKKPENPPIPPIKAQMRITKAELSKSNLSPPCIVEDYLFCDVANLAAPGGTGKTTQVLYEMVCIALGRPLCGLNILKSGWCYYVTAEDTREILIARLREIMHAMDLTDKEQETVMDRVLIWDVTGETVKLISASDGNIILTSLADDIIEAYKSDPPVLVVFDPVVSFGAGESFINDNEQGLITAGRRIIRGLGCCVRFIAHTGKANARNKTTDQYTARGGSALIDGSRMSAVLQAWQPGDDMRPPAGCTHSPESSITILARPKLSYSRPNLPLIWIKRTGWAFEHFTEIPVSDEERQKVIFNQVERFLSSQVAEGVRHNKTSLATAIPDIKRANARHAIEQLIAQGRIVDVDLPANEQKTKRKTYLSVSAEFGRIPQNEVCTKVNSAAGNNAAALRENLGGIIRPPDLPPVPNSAGGTRQDSAGLAGFDDDVEI